ncbi:MAG TPA: HepT-like ribonuclease domain-containing protein [Bryobacteraceae bacterium]|nr:HepT-like ribonuclease domain-containing protein [Bryobacteraceae bacterium]
MPFKEPALALRDIAEAVVAIKQFTNGMDGAKFREDPKTVAAVERKLQVISEAAIRLGDQAEVLCPGLPWRNIRGIGNWLRHQYDRVDVDAIWQTVTGDLPPLETAVGRALSEPPKKP